MNVIHTGFLRCLVVLAAFAAGAASAEERVTYFVPDALGSPVAAMDEQGNVLWRESYAPYGERRAKPAGNDARTAYTGKPEDGDTGLVYLGARWYDPQVGRFAGVDPVGFSVENVLSFGRYLYGSDSPYVFLDPDGREAVDLAKQAEALADRSRDFQDGGFARDAQAQLNDAGRMAAEQSVWTVLGGAATKALGFIGRLGEREIPKINWGQQEKHFPGHNSYTPGRSALTGDPEKLAERAGTGQQIGDITVGSPGSKERVKFGETIGTYVNEAGESFPTKNGIIHYGKDGIHIVPSRP